MVRYAPPMLGLSARWLVSICAVIFVALTVAPAAADVPIAGSPWAWPALKDRDWLDGAPSHVDTAGKVVVHWFCKPKLDACKDDLARIYNMREQGSVYVIAYVAGTKREGEFKKYITRLRTEAIIDWKNDEVKKAYEVGLKQQETPATP